MSDLNAAERRLRKMLSELQEAADFAVYSPRPGAVDSAYEDVDATFAEVSASTGVALDERLKRCLVRFDRISACWDLEGSENGLSGEFCIVHLPEAVDTEAPPTDLESMTAEEQQRYAQFRVFDDHPVSGTGAFAALRISPEFPDPEVWFYELHVGALKMDLDYCQYLETLTLTKGTFGWQYLFCDVSFADEDFSGTADDMREMLDVFPELFPHYDYSHLRGRLQERL